jgi:glycosyltransferase involved in cell wall biosynthesis
MRLLYFAPENEGGLADYAFAQASALVEAGAEVHALCSSGFFPQREAPFKRLPLLDGRGGRRPGSKLGRAVRMCRRAVECHQTLAETVQQGNYSQVMLSAYAEYFSPLWAGPLEHLAESGVVFGAVVHDPKRDTVMGPAVWHRWSVAKAYRFLAHAFVHEAIDLDTAGADQPEVTVIPHGPLRFNSPRPPRSIARQLYELPPGAFVLLAFGHLRDSKNLELALEALRDRPEVYLLVAGREQSGSQRPASWYQGRAEELGVAHRCRWINRFIPEDEIGSLFAAADALMLTYSSAFRSASGVLSAAAQYQLPCLASSGHGPLRTLVQRYSLGVFTEPDSAPALAAGLNELLETSPQPDWAGFETENSWSRNAELVLAAFAKTAHANLSRAIA